MSSWKYRCEIEKTEATVEICCRRVKEFPNFLNVVNCGLVVLRATKCERDKNGEVYRREEYGKSVDDRRNLLDELIVFSRIVEVEKKGDCDRPGCREAAISTNKLLVSYVKSSTGKTKLTQAKLESTKRAEKLLDSVGMMRQTVSLTQAKVQ